MFGGMLTAAERILRPGLQRKLREPVGRALFLEYRLPLGCLVHMTPVFEAIKRARPDVQIAVATRGLGLEVLRYSPFVDHLIEAPDPTRSLVAAVSGLRRELRSRDFDAGCVLTGASDQRTRIALMALLSTAAWRGGYTQKAALYQRPLTYDFGLSLIGNNLRLAALLGCAAEPVEPRVFFSSDDEKFASQLIAQVNPDNRPLVTVVTQGSGGQRTAWHIDRWTRVIDTLARHQGCAVAYVGTAAEVAAIDAIRMASGEIGTSLAGRTNVTQLAALLAQSDFVVTLDTGTMHVGRAVGVPMVVLGPSWQKPLEWMPLDRENVRILRGNDIPEMPPDYQLDEIAPDSVISAIEDLRTLYPPDAVARQQRVHTSMSAIDHLQR